MASESLMWLRCIHLQLVLVAVAAEISVAQMLKLKLWLLGLKVFSLSCFECCLGVQSLVSDCLKVFIFKGRHLRCQAVAVLVVS